MRTFEYAESSRGMGKFVLGFAIGTVAGVAYVMLTAPKPGAESRDQIKVVFDKARDVARQARMAREQELWAKFRASAGIVGDGSGYVQAQLGY